MTNQKFLEKKDSDHRPVLINLVASKEIYRGQFKFDKRMLHKPLVKESIMKAWQAYENRRNNTVSEKIRR